MDYRYIDIGLNLFNEQFAGQEDEIAERAAQQGVGFVITGSSERSSAQAAAYVKDRPDVYATAGVHPHDAKRSDAKTIARLRALFRDNARMVAVGECGLDYDRMFSPREVQLRVFEEQIGLAEELEKPLFLHERAAAADFMQVLKKHPQVCPRAVVHCYTGDRATAEQYLELGCMIGITGWVCDQRRNADLLDALQVIPAERLMAETDAPYLIPRGIRGLKNPNLPENIVYVVRKLAEVKEMEEERLRVQLLENTKRFFGI
ncbi:MAG: TatD family hydrolase [Lachnospiraceae bacterium]|nr:TatD family hydrolase [Lachnospiraceae bacterium]